MLRGHACEDGLELMLWTADCNVMCFILDGNARDSHVLCLMSADGWVSEFAGLVCDVYAWDSCILHFMMADKIKLWRDLFIITTLKVCLFCPWCLLMVRGSRFTSFVPDGTLGISVFCI